MDHQQYTLQEDKLLIWKLFIFKLKKKEDITFNSKRYIHNIAHLSGYEKGSWVFYAFRDIFHTPRSNLTPSSLTLQENIMQAWQAIEEAEAWCAN